MVAGRHTFILIVVTMGTPSNMLAGGSRPPKHWALLGFLLKAVSFAFIFMTLTTFLLGLAPWTEPDPSHTSTSLGTDGLPFLLPLVCIFTSLLPMCPFIGWLTTIKTGLYKYAESLDTELKVVGCDVGSITHDEGQWFHTLKQGFSVMWSKVQPHG